MSTKVALEMETLLKWLSSENDIEGYLIEKSVLFLKIWLKIS